MCDYSLSGLPNRLAKEGEELVVHRFRTGSMGLASAADLSRPAPEPNTPGRKNVWELITNLFASVAQPPTACAICVPPGARLVLSRVPNEVKGRWNVAEGMEVVFTQTSAMANTYRDALMMPDGRAVLLQALPQGMRVFVLSLGNAEEVMESPRGESIFA